MKESLCLLAGNNGFCLIPPRCPPVFKMKMVMRGGFEAPDSCECRMEAVCSYGFC